MNDSITKEVRLFINDKMANGEIIQHKWVTHEFVKRKLESTSIEGDDAQFVMQCIYRHVGSTVKRCIGKYDKDNPLELNSQMLLEGFQCLQKGYVIEREGKRLLIPTDLITSDELRQRAIEYDKMARGCELHAEEIRIYLLQRKEAA